MGHAAVVDAAGGDGDFHSRVVELETAGLAEVDRELGSARAVAGVGIFIVAAGIVEKGEEADDLRVGGMVAAEFHAVAQDGEPMGRAVVGSGRRYWAMTSCQSGISPGRSAEKS